MDDPGVLGHSQVRAKRELLVNRAQPERFGARRRMGALFLPGDDQPTAIRNDAAVQDVHKRRLAGAVMADDADALALSDREINAVQSPNGAIGFFDSYEVDKRSARVRPSSCQLTARALVWLGQSYFIFALIAATASACVYSWLATPPFGMFGNSFSKSSWVKAR